MKILLLLFILQLYNISSNYTYESIKEIIPKYFIFKTFPSFKIFQYIPLCTDLESINTNKNIYVQTLTSEYMELYMYDNYTLIEQDEKAYFINYKEKKNIHDSNSFFFSNLICEKDYYFVISMASKNPSYLNYKNAQFAILDEKNDIKLSPLLSDSFSIHQRKNKETIFYSYNETKYGLFSFSYKSKVQIYKNDIIIYNNTQQENVFKYAIEFEKNQNYTIYFEGPSDFPVIILELFNESKIFKHDFNTGPIILYSDIYYFEIDISNYNLNEIILFNFNCIEQYIFKYQYSSNFKGNNFIDLGHYNNLNFIPIKKTIQDSSLIIYINIYIYFYRQSFSIIELIQNKIEEIKT